MENGVVENIRKVFEKQNIDLLSKNAYEFITLHMGFIAHYDRNGFCWNYQDLKRFAQTLLSSEYSDDENYNLKMADDHPENVETIRGICAIAKNYLYPLFYSKQTEKGVEKNANIQSNLQR